MQNADLGQYREARCFIFDAVYSDQQPEGQETEGEFYSEIKILLQLIENPNCIFTATLSPEDVQSISNLPNVPNSREMIKIKDQLANWEGEFTFMAPEQPGDVTPDMILNNPKSVPSSGPDESGMTVMRESRVNKHNFNAKGKK